MKLWLRIEGAKAEVCFGDVSEITVNCQHCGMPFVVRADNVVEFGQLFREHGEQHERLTRTI